MEILFDPEEKIMCPYNPSHHISRRRMNTHLVKCKKSCPESKLVECDFNVNHKIPEPELQYHHENCPDRKKIEITIYQEEGADINKFPVHNVEVPTEETWDDLNVPTYDPKKYCENSEVLRHIDVESAANRKNFRFAERQRLSQLDTKTPVTQLQENEASSANQNVVASKRNLPDKPSVKVEENTPDDVATILQRLTLGKDKSFIPKQT